MVLGVFQPFDRLDCAGRDRETCHGEVGGVGLITFRGPGVRHWQVLNETRDPGQTVMMSAIASQNPAMVKEVFECVRHIPNKQKVIELPGLKCFLHPMKK